MASRVASLRASVRRVGRYGMLREEVNHDSPLRASGGPGARPARAPMCSTFRAIYARKVERMPLGVRVATGMRRLLTGTLFLAAAATLVLTSPAAGARGFRHGVAAGEVTSRSAVLWAHANRSGKYRLEIARNRALTRALKRKRVTALRGNDNTVQGERRRAGTRQALLVPVRREASAKRARDVRHGPAAGPQRHRRVRLDGRHGLQRGPRPDRSVLER